MKEHPILHGLDKQFKLPPKGPFEEKNWFPSDCKICSVEAAKDPAGKRRLYHGWFDKYPKDWEPLIFAGVDKKKPIMLCNIVKKEDKPDPKFGGYIITTMYIGASGLDQLIKNLFCFPNEISSYYNKK